MATKKFAAVISLAAEMGSSVRSAFGSTRGEIDRLGKTVDSLNAKQKEIKAAASASAEATSAEAKLKSETKALATLRAEIARSGVATKKQSDAFTRQKQVVDRAREAVDRKRTKLRDLERELDRAGVNSRNLSREMERLGDAALHADRRLGTLERRAAAMRRVRAAGARVGGAARNAWDAVGEVGSEFKALAFKGIAAATGGAWLFKRQFIDTAAQFETFETTLATVEGSSEKAKKAMGWISEFAAKTPYRLEEVTESFVRLKAYGMDPIKGGLLTSLGDTSSAMGKPVMQAVEAIADAVTGENERLKEFGIKAKKDGEKITYEFTNAAGKTMTATVNASNRKMIQATLQAIWNSKYKGAMDKQSKTWGGMVSNMGDQWDRFKLMVMRAGPFDALKGKLEGLLGKLDEMAANGELQKWAEKTAAKIMEFGEALRRAGKWAVDTGERVWKFIEPIGGMKIVLGGAAVVLGGSFLMACGGAAVALGTLGAASIAALPSLIALAATVGPIGLAAAAATLAVGLFAKKVYDDWGTLGPWLKDVWNDPAAAWETLWLGLKSIASDTWDSVKSGIDSTTSFFKRKWDDAIGWVGNKWKSIKGFFGFGEGPERLNEPVSRGEPPRSIIRGAGGGNRVANSNNRYNITINATAGQDAKAIADETYSRLSLQNAALAGGALYD